MIRRAVAALPLPAARNHVVLIAAAAIAWTILLVEGAGWTPPLACLSPVAAAPTRYWSEWRAFSGSPFFAGTLTAWLLMFAAMMLPLLAAPLASVASQSFPARRNEARALFLSGYASIWLAALAGMLALLIGVRSLGFSHAAYVQPLLLALAAWWHGTRWKHAALIACHRPTSLAAFGPRAAADALAYGCTYALACVANCWLVMLAMIFGHDSLLATAIVAIVLFAERYARQAPVRFGQMMLLLAAIAAVPRP